MAGYRANIKCSIIAIMKLSEYFAHVAYKRLSAVEADAERSHQHEFNGIGSLKEIFGTEKKEFSAKFIYLAEEMEYPITADVRMTWYDARANHETRTEYRLYYQDTEANQGMKEGDLLILAVRPDDRVYVFIAQQNSTYDRQLSLLFELPEAIGEKMEAKNISESGEKVDFVKSFILEEIGVEVRQTDENFLDRILSQFPAGFPTTEEFSEFARNTLADVDVAGDPDGALISWMQREELLFKTFEKHLMSKKIQDVGDDVDRFIELSLSMQNRRKARVGRALENHLETIFRELEIPYTRGGETENNSKPDFIFPGIEQYTDKKFPADKLRMLGAKSTCKDRWRQVLAEAARIKNKHLLTLEPGISANQTDEMAANNLNLVVPEALFETYSVKQRKWLINLKQFTRLVK